MARSTQAENVIAVYNGEELEAVIHYERRLHRATIYKCEPMSAEEIAERIAPPKEVHEG
mgnify:CR=1 FL=1